MPDRTPRPMNQPPYIQSDVNEALQAILAAIQAVERGQIEMRSDFKAHERHDEERFKTADERNSERFAHQAVLIDSVKKALSGEKTNDDPLPTRVKRLENRMESSDRKTEDLEKERRTRKWDWAKSLVTPVITALVTALIMGVIMKVTK